MRRTARPGASADVVAVLVTFLLLGVLCGVVWWLLVDPAEFTRTRAGGGAMGELQLAERFDSDGWYSVIAMVAGFLSGAAVTWWRARDYLLTTLLLVPGAGLAAATTAIIGGVLGPGDPDAALAALEPGQTVPVELAVTATATYLVWPIAVLAGALMVLWSSSRAPGEAPATSAASAEGEDPVEADEDAEESPARRSSG